MTRKSAFTPYVRRLALCGIVALAFVAAFSEGSHWFLKDPADRAPQTVRLVIPAGTAARVAAGEAVPSIPAEMTFTLGDVLEVVNQDDVDHQLGPVWVPPGRSATLKMEAAEQYAYACSFQPSRYLGLNVRQPTTLLSRAIAIGFATPATTMFLFVYSLLLFPLDREGRQERSREQMARARGGAK